jgi:hypothetical protein
MPTTAAKPAAKPAGAAKGGGAAREGKPTGAAKGGGAAREGKPAGAAKGGGTANKGGKPVAKAAAKGGGAGTKKAAPKKVEPTPAELEEQQYLLETGAEPLAADPWAAHRSPYGGSLSPGALLGSMRK